MELDELKAGWSVLNERLQQQEILNKRIIQEMIRNRTNSARSSMLRFDIFGCVILFIVLVILPFFFKSVPVVTASSAVMLEGIMIFAFLLQLYATSFIARFRMDTMNLRQLTSLALNYQLWIKRDLYISYVLIILAFPAFLILQQGAITSEIWPYVFVTAILIGTIVLSRFIYTHFYSRHIGTILKGLEELKEFEEE